MKEHEFRRSFGSTAFPTKESEKPLFPLKCIAARHGRWKPQEDESLMRWFRVKYMFQPQSKTQLNAWNCFYPSLLCNDFKFGVNKWYFSLLFSIWSIAHQFCELTVCTFLNCFRGHLQRFTPVPCLKPATEQNSLSITYDSLFHLLHHHSHPGHCISGLLEYTSGSLCTWIAQTDKHVYL